MNWLQYSIILVLLDMNFLLLNCDFRLILSQCYWELRLILMLRIVEVWYALFEWKSVICFLRFISWKNCSHLLHMFFLSVFNNWVWRLVHIVCFGIITVFFLLVFQWSKHLLVEIIIFWIRKCSFCLVYLVNTSLKLLLLWFVKYKLSILLVIWVYIFFGSFLVMVKWNIFLLLFGKYGLWGYNCYPCFS